MNYSFALSATLVMLMITAGVAYAKDVFVYPAGGQNAEQQKKDEFECYDWAKGDSGFDPMAPPRTTSAPPGGQKKTGGVAKGALTGLAVGAIVGDKSKYAARGAVTGGLLGGIRQSEHNKQIDARQAQWGRDESTRYQQRRNNYNRAYSACLEGRGYSVK